MLSSNRPGHRPEDLRHARRQSDRPNRRKRLFDRHRRIVEDAAGAAARRDVQRGGAGEVPRVQGSARRRRRLHGDGRRVREVPRRRVFRGSDSARGAHRRMRDSRGRRRLRGSAAVAQAARCRIHRRALLRKRRRRRRHVVLEPLSRHRVRRGGVQLPAAARRNGLRADDEVRVGLRDSRVLPEDGRQVRLLRSLSVPHHRRGDDVGRSEPAAGRLPPIAATGCARVS